MATSLKFYADSSLTTEITQQDIDQFTDGSTGDIDKTVYIGSTISTSTFQTTVNPGVDQIVLSIVDANPGADIEATNIKLALSSGGLATATAGASLNLGTSITGGSGNAIPIYIRSDTPVLAATNSDITLTTNDLTETL